MHRCNRQMAAAGVEGFMLIVRGRFGGDWHTTWFWRDDGVDGDESDRADDVTDALSGRLVSRRCSRFTFQSNAPDTRVFLLD